MLPIGLVNVYVIEGEPLTLIDTGPKMEEAHDALRHGLKNLRHSIADVEQILLTHGHIDHAGLAETIRRESGATLLVPQGERDSVDRFPETFEARGKRFREELLRSGAPPETCDLVDDFFDWIRKFGESARVDGVVRDGDLLRAGAVELRAIHTPGHSAGSTCYLEADRVLFCGDSMIRDATPNAAFGGADGVSVGLADHLASLTRLRELPVVHVLPGHRERFEDLKAYIADYMQQFRIRQEAILRLLKPGPLSPFDLMVETFGTLPIQEIFLGVTEVLGHLEVLEIEGAVVVDEKAGHRVYRLATV